MSTSALRLHPALGFVALLALFGGCATAETAKDSVSEEDTVPLLTGCDNWDNWSCQTSANYCYALCSDGGSNDWIGCYPGTSYPCAGTFANGDSCYDYEVGEDNCDACFSALTVCGVD